MRKFLSEKINLEKVSEINARFKEGRVRMTPMVRLILFLLKIYIFCMVILLGVKFIQILSGGGE